MNKRLKAHEKGTAYLNQKMMIKIRTVDLTC